MTPTPGNPFALPEPPPDWGARETVAQAEAWVGGYLQHLSANGLRLFKVCPEAFRQRYFLGRKERPGEALVLGSAVHDAIHFSHRQKVETHEDLPVPEVVEFFHDKAWPDAISERGEESEIKWDNKVDEVRRDGERVTRAYHNVVSPRVQPLRVEWQMEYFVPGVPVPVLGYIDVEEEHVNIDLKTGKQVSRKPDANWRTQGAIYSAFTGKPTHFHSISRAKTPSIATPLESAEMSVDVGVVQREAVEGMLRHYARDIEMYYERYGPDETWPTTGVFFDYKGGKVCDYCGFRGTCPAWAHERVIVTDMNDIHGHPITVPR